MSIVKELQQKIKSLDSLGWIDGAMWFAIIFFLSLGSFSLGMMYERNQIREQHLISIEYNQAALELWDQYELIKYSNTEFFASKNGTIVYPVGCSRGDRIKEENKVYFTDIQQALDLGYREVEGC